MKFIEAYKTPTISSLLLYFIHVYCHFSLRDSFSFPFFSVRFAYMLFKFKLNEKWEQFSMCQENCNNNKSNNNNNDRMDVKQWRRKKFLDLLPKEIWNKKKRIFFHIFVLMFPPFPVGHITFIWCHVKEINRKKW